MQTDKNQEILSVLSKILSADLAIKPDWHLILIAKYLLQ